MIMQQHCFHWMQEFVQAADLDDPLFYGLDHLELFLRAQHILMQLKTCRQTHGDEQVYTITHHDMSNATTHAL